MKRSYNPDLSTISGLNLLRVSISLQERTSAPDCMGMEVGIYRGRFYKIDFNLNCIQRLTYGAFRHLSEAWRRDRAVPAAQYEAA